MDVGLPVSLLLPILRSVRRSVQELRDVLNSIELRLVGSSLLIVYEGDWDHAEVGVQWLANHPESVNGDEGERKEEEICEDAEGEVEEVEGSEVESEEEDDDDDDGDDDQEEEGGGSDCPCVVRLIDFAHTRLAPGQGPDLGVLKGLETLLGLLDGRIAALNS
jgi:1D-myo-inositol-tetrakisphosphate 5-kinase/inositol-polyphosphate multikinase